MHIIEIGVISVGLMLFCQAELEVKEARFDLSKTPQITCGSVYKCEGTAFIHQTSVRNQRCVWTYAIKSAVKYDIVYKKFSKTDDKKTVASILVPDSGMLLSAFFAENSRIDNYVLKNADEFTVDANVLIFTFWSNQFFTDDSIIHFIEVKAVKNQRQVSPAALHSNYAMFTPNMGHFRHPPKVDEIIENDEQRHELSLYILLPPSNVIGLPLEQSTMKITLKRVSPTGGLPRCEVQSVDLRTLNLSVARNPAWTHRNEICDDKPIGSLTFFDVGMIIVRSIREQKDIRRAFEVFYTQ